MAQKGKGAGQGANSEQDHAAELINSENKANIAATQAGGARFRRKGDRIERELVSLHKALGIHSERYPLSGASRFRDSGHDIDIYLFGRDAAPLVAEVKSRKYGGGFVQLERWLGEYDALFLRRNNTHPLVILPWRVWSRLIARAGHE
jgi:hypothetical protein